MNSRNVSATFLKTALGLLLALHYPPLLAAENVQPASAEHPDLVLTPAEVQALNLADSAESRPANSGSSPPQNTGPPSPPVRVSILDTVIKLGVIVLLVYVSLLFYRGIAQRRRYVSDNGETTLCILQTVPLHGSKSIHLVEAGPRTFLIAESGSRLAILADLTPSSRTTGESCAAQAVERAHARTLAKARYASAKHAEVIEDNDVEPALEWEDECPTPATRVRRPAARQHRRMAHPTPNAGSDDNDATKVIRSRRALLLRALRSREDSRREPAFTQSERI